MIKRRTVFLCTLSLSLTLLRPQSISANATQNMPDSMSPENPRGRRRARHPNAFARRYKITVHEMAEMYLWCTRRDATQSCGTAYSLHSSQRASGLGNVGRRWATLCVKKIVHARSHTRRRRRAHTLDPIPVRPHIAMNPGDNKFAFAQ